MTVAVAAYAATVLAALPVPVKIKPGITKVKPESEGIGNLISLSTAVVPPNWIVSIVATDEELYAYNQISSSIVEDVPVAWIVVPVDAVAATLIALPCVEPERSTLE